MTLTVARPAAEPVALTAHVNRVVDTPSLIPTHRRRDRALLATAGFAGLAAFAASAAGFALVVGW